MSDYTTNLNLVKKDPDNDGNDYFNIKTILNDNWDKIDAAVAEKETSIGAQAKVDNLAGTGRTTQTVKGNADAITALNQTVTSHKAESAAHGAVSTATANKIIIRDVNGRAKVAAPSASDDIARKDTIDAVQTNLTTHTSAAAPHSGHITHSLATAANDFLVASGAGTFVKKTLAEVKTILGMGAAAFMGTGTTSNTVALGNHSHAGVYEPVDTDIMRKDVAQTMSATLVARTGTDHTTKRVRNSVYKTGSDFTTSELADGDFGFLY